MKKIGILAIFAVIFSLAAATGVSAVKPEWEYECAKSVLPVTVDGKVGEGEWDDAVLLTVNNDSEIFQKYGFWQNTGGDPIPSSSLSVDYKLKWDETYLYILEVRYDKNFSFNPDAGDWPWEASGTLLFLAYDPESYEEPGDGAYEIFWVMNPDGSSPKLTGRASPGKTQFEKGDPEMDGWVVANSVNGDTYTIELAIPWATMQKVSGFPAPAEGVKLRFTPVISAYHLKVTESAYDETWNQLDFYVNTDSPDDITGEGGLVLTGAIYTPPAPEPEAEPEAAPEAAPAPAEPAAPAETAPAQIPAAPATGDGTTVFLAIVLAAAAFEAARRAAKAK
ncbi:MAG: hypothetical protein FWG34_02675 [Oscillospiraceae bacterium]|nr:hypothetical protein [Oscillospiraceae bacterium]